MRVYHQVSQGYGERSDFTTQNIKDKADFSHNYEKMGTMKYQIDMNKKKGTTRSETFGNPYNRYEKSMVHGMKSHYLGKG